MNINDAITKLEAIAKLPEKWRNQANHGPLPNGLVSGNHVKEYRIAPDTAPAGKLTDEQLGEIGGKACHLHGWLSPSRATSFACAVREAVEKGTPWGAVGQTQEEWLHSTSELGRMAHERFVGEIARLTAELEIFKKIRDGRMELQAKYDDLQVTMDSVTMNANWSIERMKEAQAELAKANAELERYTKECGALIVEHSKLQAELERLRWRPVSVKPTREDADTADRITVLCKNGKMQRVPLDAMGFRPDFDWSKSDDGEQFMFWRPTCPPPAPTAEEKERAEFEKWFKETTEKEGFSKNFGQIAFEAWKAALASIEVKHS